MTLDSEALCDIVYGLPLDPTRRKVAVLLIEVVRSNPNGDPDRGGAPRMDYHGHGLISAICMKRQFKDYASNELGLPLHGARDADIRAARESYNNSKDLVARNFDARCFGALLPKMVDRTRVIGPIQMSDARSVDPVDPETMANTFVSHITEREVEGGEDPEAVDVDPDAVLKVKKTKKTKKDDGSVDKRGNMGNRELITFGLYRTELTFLPQRAKMNGVAPEDLAAIWECIIESWALNRASHRCGVNLRRLVVFDFPQARGSVPEHVLARRVRTERVVGESGWAAQQFEDYAVSVDTTNLPANLTVYDWADGVVTRHGA